jgi:hypothetical protein
MLWCPDFVDYPQNSENGVDALKILIYAIQQF